MLHVQRAFFQLAWFLGVLPSIVHADGYALFSKHLELKGHAIIDAGDVEKIEPPFGKLGSTEILKLGANCFEAQGYFGYSGYSKRAGLVLVDRSRNLKLALIESSIGSIRIELVSVTQIACTAHDSDALPQDPQQRLQELKRRQELLQREIDRRRQQK